MTTLRVGGKERRLRCRLFVKFDFRDASFEIGVGIRRKGERPFAPTETRIGRDDLNGRPDTMIV